MRILDILTFIYLSILPSVLFIFLSKSKNRRVRSITRRQSHIRDFLQKKYKKQG